MNNFLIFLIVLALLLILIAYFQVKNVEQFTSHIDNLPNTDKLLIKKTNQYKKIFSNKMYSIWMPVSIDDYYPTGCCYTKNKMPPKSLATLVKNEYGNTSKDKPDKYDILAITNNNNAYWYPIPQQGYSSLGIMCSKEYPSKFSLRCVPKKFTNKTNIVKKLVTNSVSQSDKGYEIWSLNNSNNIAVSNLNNSDNIDNLKNIRVLDETKCSVEKKLYIKYTTSYKKVGEYVDNKTQNKCYIWSPVPPNNFCIIGYVCLNNNQNPNNKLKTIVVHKSSCRIPLDYGKKSIIDFKINEDENISFWRPTPPKNYCCLGDVPVLGNQEPNSDNLIHCISLDYVNESKNKRRMVWNNIDNKKSASIWSDNNNVLTISNGYSDHINNYVLNEDLFTSDSDLLDDIKVLQLNYRKNKNNNEKIDKEKLAQLVKQNLVSKLDVNSARLKEIIVNKGNIELTIDSRKSGSSELTVKEVIQKLKNILDNGDIRIYNNEKSDYYIIIDTFIIKNLDNNSVLIDNSLFVKKY